LRRRREKKTDRLEERQLPRRLSQRGKKGERETAVAASRCQRNTKGTRRNSEKRKPGYIKVKRIFISPGEGGGKGRRGKVSSSIL